MEEIKTNAPGEENVDDSVDYIAAINEMKQNSVSKSEYEKLKLENKRLLDSIVNGTAEDNKITEKPSIDELRKNVFSQQCSNLEFWKNALELRKAVMEEGGEDPFVPVGVKVSANQIDFDGAEKLAAGIQHCIEYADGDSQLFTNELQRITREVMPQRKK